MSTILQKIAQRHNEGMQNLESSLMRERKGQNKPSLQDISTRIANKNERAFQQLLSYFQNVSEIYLDEQQAKYYSKDNINANDQQNVQQEIETNIMQIKKEQEQQSYDGIFDQNQQDVNIKKQQVIISQNLEDNVNKIKIQKKQVQIQYSQNDYYFEKEEDILESPYYSKNQQLTIKQYKQKLYSYQIEEQNPQQDLLKRSQKFKNLEFIQNQKNIQSSNSILQLQKNMKKYSKVTNLLGQKERKNKAKQAQEKMRANIEFLNQLKLPNIDKYSQVKQWRQQPDKIIKSIRSDRKKKLDSLGLSNLKSSQSINKQSKIMQSVELPKIKQKNQKFVLLKPQPYSLYSVNRKRHQLFYNS